MINWRSALGDSSVNQGIGVQISPLEIKARASPYRELRISAKSLLSHIDNLRTFVETDELIRFAWREFQQAYDNTYRSDMSKFRTDETVDNIDPNFEIADCGLFNQCLFTIGNELESIEESIRTLKKSEPKEVSLIQTSLIKVTKNLREIIARSDKRLETMTFSRNRAISEERF